MSGFPEGGGSPLPLGCPILRLRFVIPSIVNLAKLDKSDSRGAQYVAINTDEQVGLELPTIRNGTDMFQRRWTKNECGECWPKFEFINDFSDFLVRTL